MTISLKADPSGTFGELQINGTPRARLDADGLKTPENTPYFKRDNILGAVSQVAGVPTGAVIERGSNANGHWVKFADGTQICDANYGETPVLAVAATANVTNSANTWTYPSAFVGSTPSVNYGVLNVTISLDYSGSVNTNAFSATSASITLRMTVTQTYRLCALAIGRWF